MTDRHHILVIAVNRKRVRGDGARRDVENRAGEFTRDLVHVGDHQQQALRGGEGGGKRAGLQSAVDRARRAAFGLHFDYEGDCAPKILPAFGRPLVCEFTHGGGWRNRINRDNLAQTVSY